MPRHIAILACLIFTLATARHAVAADDSGWTSLFNDKNLDGWVVKCGS